MNRIIVGILLVSCITGYVAAESVVRPAFRDVNAHTAEGSSQGTSFITCPAGYQCLWESEASNLFGTNYERYSGSPCGQGELVEVMLNKYCYRARPSVNVSQAVQQYSWSVRTTTPAGEASGATVRRVAASRNENLGGTGPASDAGEAARQVEQAVQLNPQPEPPNPEDLVKLNPQPEPPKPASTGFFDTLFGLFSGLFGGTGSGSTTAPSQGSGDSAPSMQVMGGETCLYGMKKCNGICSDISSDPNNCGDCGITCPGLKVCSLGTCSDKCTTGLVECSGRSCVNLQTDQNNCGSCGKKCGPTSQCSDGKCVGLLSNAPPVEGQQGLVARAAEKATAITVFFPKEGDTIFKGYDCSFCWDRATIPSKYENTKNSITIVVDDNGNKIDVASVKIPGNLACVLILIGDKSGDKFKVKYIDDGHLNYADDSTNAGLMAGTHKYRIDIETDDSIYKGSSGWFTITDRPSSRIAANIIDTSRLIQAETNTHLNIYVFEPMWYYNYTQGKDIGIWWDNSDIKEYDTVKIELFRLDGTFVMNVGDLRSKSETGLHPNTGDNNNGVYFWSTYPYQGGTGVFPCPGCKTLYENAGKGKFYIQISTPDGVFAGKSGLFYIDPKELPPANIPSQ